MSLLAKTTASLGVALSVLLAATGLSDILYLLLDRTPMLGPLAVVFMLIGISYIIGSVLLLKCRRSGTVILTCLTMLILVGMIVLERIPAGIISLVVLAALLALSTASLVELLRGRRRKTTCIC